MLQLLKVRLKYYKSCKYYCLISICIIFNFLLFLLTLIKKSSIEYLPKKEYQKEINPYYLDLFNITDYSDLNIYMKETSLIVNDKDIGSKLQNYINETLKIKISLNDEDLPNHIILDYNKDSKLYKFSYFIKDKNYNNKIFPFKSYMLSNYDAKDLFNSIDINTLNSSYLNNAEHIYNYLYYNSLLSKFIIQQTTGKLPDKTLNISLGFNSFPPSRYENNDSFFVLLIMIVNLEFYYVSVFLTTHLFEEKHQKLYL